MVIQPPSNDDFLLVAAAQVDHPRLTTRCLDGELAHQFVGLFVFMSVVDQAKCTAVFAEVVQRDVFPDAEVCN
ncbi:hypothetical protein D3C85_1561670 [compost metagenome]